MRKFFVLAALALVSLMEPPLAQAQVEFEDLNPEFVSYDPLIINFPKAALEEMLKEAVFEEVGYYESGDIKFRASEVTPIFHDGVIEVKVKGEAKYSGFIDWTTVRLDLKVGIGVYAWIVEAVLIHTEVKFSNSIIEFVKKAFTKKIHDPLNASIKKSLNKFNGMNLREEVEAGLGFPLADNAVLNVTITPFGISLEASEAPPARPVVEYRGMVGTGTIFYAGDSLVSDDGRFRLVFQADQNLVLYMGSAPLWNAKTNGKGGSFVAFQADGNLVIYREDGYPVWNSKSTRGDAGAVLAMQSDGNLVIYSGGRALWASGTDGY